MRRLLLLSEMSVYRKRVEKNCFFFKEKIGLKKKTDVNYTLNLERTKKIENSVGNIFNVYFSINQRLICYAPSFKTNFYCVSQMHIRAGE